MGVGFVSSSGFTVAVFSSVFSFMGKYISSPAFMLSLRLNFGLAS